MAIYRTDEDYAKRAALAKALREYADVVEQGAPIASSVYRADTPRDPRPLPSSLHITLEQINITFPPASFWRAAIVPYSDPNALDPQFVERLTAAGRAGAEAGEALKQALGSWYADPRNGPFPRFSEDTAAEQQAADSTPPPWRDRLADYHLAQIALAEAYCHDGDTIQPDQRSTLGKAFDTIAALVQILDERE